MGGSEGCDGESVMGREGGRTDLLPPLPLELMFWIVSLLAGETLSRAGSQGPSSEERGEREGEQREGKEKQGSIEGKGQEGERKRPGQVCLPLSSPLQAYLASSWHLYSTSGIFLSLCIQFISVRIDLEVWGSGHVTSSEVM